MLATILSPTSGTALIDGLDVTQRPGEVRKRIGYLSGETKLYDRLTARELLSYFGELAGMSGPSIAGRIAELRISFGLGDFLDKRVGKMSTGMKQRLSLARVVLHDPPVLIFDEPTSGLDVMGAREVLRIVQELKTKGRTIIFSTHIMTEAERICDEIAIIERGAILAQGSVSALMAKDGCGSLEDVFVKTVGEVTSDV
jgi:sodium transport system ATP-binding protein